MSESENAGEEIISFDELYEYETRNLAGCDNDDSCCTFPKGYVYRQALYHCLTCKNITGKQAGICYPCSVHCHRGHVLEDLYTKRNFRCDCGNSNFPDDFRCNLWEEKDDVNTKNAYNHNFSGLYCVCNLEYDERKDTDEMIQCIICEDWYHLKHLVESNQELQAVESLNEFEEFICKMCIARRQYLSIYNRADLNNLLKKFVDGSAVQESGNDVGHTSTLCRLAAITRELNEIDCQSMVPGFNCGAFMQSDWRRSLCRCVNCLTLMKQDGTAFLLDNRDTITYYYDNSQTMDDEMIDEELANMPYSQAILFAEGVSTFKRHFSDFISSLDGDKVVTADDVHKFFDNIKRRRLENPE